MLLPEKCTARRGRSVVPETRLRMRSWRIWVEDRFAILLNSLALLAANYLAGITHTFSLVRLRRIVASNVRSHLAHGFLIHTLHLDLRIFRYGNFDVLGNREQNRMRET